MSICYPDTTDWSCADENFVADMDPTIKARSEALAWSTLRALTGFRLSICPSSIRPCAMRCGMPTWFVAPAIDGWGTGSAFTPYIWNGSWFNACGCGTPDSCSCTFLSEVRLPTEVGMIDQVWLNGAVLEPSAYRVDNGNRLVRTDGGVWPVCQDMNEPADGDNAFTVSWYPGVAPNELFNYAAGIMALEYYKACQNQDCRLPAGVTNITRAGVVMEVPGGSFPGGWTGIHEVDAVIRIYNPYGLKARARALSVDVPRGRTQTWGA